MAQTWAAARWRRASVDAPRSPGDRTVPIEGREQGGNAVAGRRGGDQHLRPLGLGPRRIGGAAGRRDEHRAELGGRPQRARLVALVDHDQVGDLEQAGLDGLDLVAHLGRLEHDRRVGRGRDLDLALAGADRLDEHQVEAGGVEHRGGGRRRRGEAAGVAARRHRADEDVAVVRRRPASGPGRPAGRRR